MAILVDGMYLTDGFFINALSNNNELDASAINSNLSLNLDVSKAEAVGSTNEIAILNRIILRKAVTIFGIELDDMSTDQFVEIFMRNIDEENIDLYSIILTLGRNHLLAIIYLLYNGRITETDLYRILKSTEYRSRNEILLSFFKEEPAEKLDLFLPLKVASMRRANFKNPQDMTTIEKEHLLEEMESENNSYKINSKLDIGPGNILTFDNMSETKPFSDIDLDAILSKLESTNLNNSENPNYAKIRSLSGKNFNFASINGEKLNTGELPSFIKAKYIKDLAESGKVRSFLHFLFDGESSDFKGFINFLKTFNQYLIDNNNAQYQYSSTKEFMADFKKAVIGMNILTMLKDNSFYNEFVGRKENSLQNEDVELNRISLNIRQIFERVYLKTLLKYADAKMNNRFKKVDVDVSGGIDADIKEAIALAMENNGEIPEAQAVLKEFIPTSFESEPTATFEDIVNTIIDSNISDLSFLFNITNEEKTPNMSDDNFIRNFIAIDGDNNKILNNKEKVKAILNSNNLFNFSKELNKNINSVIGTTGNDKLETMLHSELDNGQTKFELVNYGTSNTHKLLCNICDELSERIYEVAKKSANKNDTIPEYLTEEFFIKNFSSIYNYLSSINISSAGDNNELALLALIGTLFGTNSNIETFIKNYIMPTEPNSVFASSTDIIFAAAIVDKYIDMIKPPMKTVDSKGNLNNLFILNTTKIENAFGSNDLDDKNTFRHRFMKLSNTEFETIIDSISDDQDNAENIDLPLNLTIDEVFQIGVNSWDGNSLGLLANMSGTDVSIDISTKNAILGTFKTLAFEYMAYLNTFIRYCYEGSMLIKEQVLSNPIYNELLNPKTKPIDDIEGFLLQLSSNPMFKYLTEYYYANNVESNKNKLYYPSTVISSNLLPNINNGNLGSSKEELNIFFNGNNELRKQIPPLKPQIIENN